MRGNSRVAVPRSPGLQPVRGITPGTRSRTIMNFTKIFNFSIRIRRYEGMTREGERRLKIYFL